MRLVVEMRDRPGELGRLLAVIAQQGANVRMRSSTTARGATVRIGARARDLAGA